MSEDFWLSDEGILVRTEDLANSFVVSVYNNALKGAFKEAGFNKFLWVAVLDDKTCRFCEEHDGRVYTAGMFMPSIPKHNGCRCFWDVEIGLS